MYTSFPSSPALMPLQEAASCQLSIPSVYPCRLCSNQAPSFPKPSFRNQAGESSNPARGKQHFKAPTEAPAKANLPTKTGQKHIHPNTIHRL
ncbi:hypothetical protein VTH06DRAFT_6135 [Thermothelomyces fergusii]